MVNGFNGITTMQEMVASVCHSAPFGEEGQLTDTRDNKSYWVAKLNDGNCWMTQNLDLDLNKANLLTPDNSDVSNSWPSSALTSALWTGNNNDYNEVKYYDPANGGAPTYCNDGGVAGKCKQSGNSTTSVNNGHDAQGNYYSWGAATAGTSGAANSICPKGWRLPTGGNNGDFYNAFDGMTVTTITTNPYYFVYGGIVTNSSLTNIGNQGRYWSSTSSSTSGAYRLFFDINVNSTGADSRYWGLSVRCVAR